MGWLEGIIDNFQFIFWMLIVFGSSVASFLKKRHEAQRTSEGMPSGKKDLSEMFEMPDLEEWDEAEEWPEEETVEVALPEATPMPPLPVTPPSGVWREEPARVGALETRHLANPSDFETLESEIGQVSVTQLNEELAQRKLGTLDATEAATIIRRTTWRPQGGWRHAVVLSEVFGPPRSLAPWRASGSHRTPLDS